MNFSKSIKEGFVKKTNKDVIRAKSLISASKDTIEIANSIKQQEKALKTILRELYEGLRQYCEALGYIRGYKFLSHKSITCFLKDILKEEKISFYFDRLRKLRNGINYYGREISLETVKEAIIEIPKITKQLKKYEKN